jgi:hypothetical protein
LVNPSISADPGAAKASGSDTAASDVDSTVITRGAAIGDAPTVMLAEVVENPEKFTTEPVIFEGSIAEVCQKKGCWMKVVSDSSDIGTRVTFKDYGFFVPTNSKNWLVRAEGVFHVKVWTKEEADHLVGEGAQLSRNADGRATEIGFVATGVELKKKTSVEVKEVPAEASDDSR